MLYMSVTADKFELPLYVADSAAELALHYHVTKNAVQSSISKAHSGRTRGYKFIRVEEIDDE